MEAGVPERHIWRHRTTEWDEVSLKTLMVTPTKGLRRWGLLAELVAE